MASEPYSLHDAAYASNRTPIELRRDILLGKIPAQAVADERQFLIRPEDLGLPPRRRNRWIWAIPIVMLALQTTGIAYFWSYEQSYFCTDCGRERRQFELFRSLPVRSDIRDTELTPRLDRAVCHHQWILHVSIDYGGTRLQGPGFAVWRKATAMKSEPPDRIRQVLQKASVSAQD